MLSREAVADSSDRFKMLWMRRVVFKYLANLQDEIVYGPVGGIDMVAPHRVEQLITADNLPFATDQLFQNHALLARKLGLPARSFCLEGPEIDPVSTEFISARSRAFGGQPGLPPENPLDSGQKLGNIKRLGDIVVTAYQETLYFHLFFVTSSQEQDRHRVPLIPNISTNRQSVFPGQHDVEQDDVKHPPVKLLKHLRPLGHMHDLVTLGLEVHAQPVGQVQIVFNQQNCFHNPLPVAA